LCAKNVEGVACEMHVECTQHQCFLPTVVCEYGSIDTSRGSTGHLPLLTRSLNGAALMEETLCAQGQTCWVKAMTTRRIPVGATPTTPTKNQNCELVPDQTLFVIGRFRVERCGGIGLS